MVVEAEALEPQGPPGMKQGAAGRERGAGLGDEKPRRGQGPRQQK